MGQIEVYNYIKNKGWVSSKQISKELNHNINSTSRCLTSLIKYKMAEKKTIGFRKFLYRGI